MHKIVNFQIVIDDTMTQVLESNWPISRILFKGDRLKNKNVLFEFLVQNEKNALRQQ